MPIGKKSGPVIIFFLLLSTAILVAQSSLASWGFRISLLFAGNVILFVMTMFSLHLLDKGMRASGTSAFLRFVYGSFMVKFFIVVFSMLIYGFLNRKQINKPALFSLMFLYLVYTFMEIGILMRNQGNEKN